MQLFTINQGVEEGVKVSTLELKSGVKIPAIIVGENGRGRKTGVIPVQLLQESDEEWFEKGHVTIQFARIGETRTGNIKLIQTESIEEESQFLAVLRTPIGFRGGNDHTGDRLESKYFPEYSLEDKFKNVGITLPSPKSGEQWYTEREAKSLSSQVYGEGYQDTAGFRLERLFKPWPGKNLVQGTIAQGDAGGMGSGSQLVSVLPVGEVFRTGISGRRYGSPSAYYYLHDGKKLSCMTWEEREVADLW